MDDLGIVIRDGLFGALKHAYGAWVLQFPRGIAREEYLQRVRDLLRRVTALGDCPERRGRAWRASARGLLLDCCAFCGGTRGGNGDWAGYVPFADNDAGAYPRMDRYGLWLICGACAGRVDDMKDKRVYGQVWPVEILQDTFFRTVTRARCIGTATARVLILAECSTILLTGCTS